MKKIKFSIFIIIFYLIYTLYITYLPLSIFDIDLSVLNDFTKILYLLAFDLILILILYFLYRKVLKNDLVDFKKNWRDYIELGIKCWIVGLVIMVISNLLIQVFITTDIAENEAAVRGLIKLFPFYMLFATCIYAPFIEELIFRKVLKDIFNYKWIFIFISGFSFGTLHVIGTMNTYTDLFYIIPYSSIGCTFAYLYFKTKNIWSSITMHFIHNTLFVSLEIFLLFI